MRTMDAAMHALLAERGEDEPGRISAETYPHAPMSREGFAQVRALSATCGLRISAETGACPWDGRGWTWRRRWRPRSRRRSSPHADGSTCIGRRGVIRESMVR